MYGKIAVRLDHAVLATLLHNHTGTMTGGNVTCRIGTLHVHDKNLVERSEGTQAPLKMFLGIICLHDSRYAYSFAHFFPLKNSLICRRRHNTA